MTTRTPLLFGPEDVDRLLPMPECIDLMAETLAGLARGDFHLPLRTIVRPPSADGLMVLMPVYRALPHRAYAVKNLCVVPSNSERGLDPHQGSVMLLDGETGQLRAVVDASRVTAIRTAAVSGLATRLLARENATRLAVIGSGVQARAHLKAMALVRPLERALVWSPRRAQALVDELVGCFDFPIAAAESAEAAVRGADIVVTATSASGPVLDRDWLSKGVHVNTIGVFSPTTRELDSRTIRDASFFVDRRESAENEAGDYLIPLSEGVIEPDHIRAELGEVVLGSHPGRTSPDEITVFKSLGIAVEDLAAVEYLVDRGA